MTGFEFEEYLYVLFVALEYEETYLTKKSGDFGADLLFVDENEQKTVVQAKRLTGKLGLSAIQEVYAAKAYYGAKKAIIITSTNDLSGACLKLAAATEVTIIDRDELNEIITLFKRGSLENARQQIEEPHEPISYNPSASLEVIKQKRGKIQAGEYYYKY